MKRLLMIGGTALMAVTALMAAPAHAEDCRPIDRDCERPIYTPDRFGYVAPVFPAYQEGPGWDRLNDHERDRHDRRDDHRDGRDHDRR